MVGVCGERAAESGVDTTSGPAVATEADTSTGLPVGVRKQAVGGGPAAAQVYRVYLQWQRGSHGTYGSASSHRTLERTFA